VRFFLGGLRINICSSTGERVKDSARVDNNSHGSRGPGRAGADVFIIFNRLCPHRVLFYVEAQLV